MKLFLSVFVSLFALTAIADTHSDDELVVEYVILEKNDLS